MKPMLDVIAPAVSQHIGRPWNIASVVDLADLACHPAYLVSDGSFQVFAKHSSADNATEQFGVELAGLSLLRERAGIRVPTPVGVVTVAAGCWLVLEAVQPIEPTVDDWRAVGLALARIHRIHGAYFGLETNGFIGPVRQDNHPTVNWPEFYLTRRLEPALRLASDSGYLPEADRVAVERVMTRAGGLCGPSVPPTLVHGDAQRNNWIHSTSGPVAIDPAVHYGHPEMDLAFLGMWQPVPDCVLEAYAECAPLDPGFADRAELWRIWGYLLGVAVEGPTHLARLRSAVSKYL